MFDFSQFGCISSDENADGAASGSFPCDRGANSG
jgi:hypothetical protein